MNKGRRNRAKACAVMIMVQCSIILYSMPHIRPQKPVIRHYDERDGLAHHSVSSIRQDIKGYLWFGTREGLSRFDGYNFTNYGLRDGLPNLNVTALLEDHEGHFWVGTYGGGMARLIDDPGEGPMRRPSEVVTAERKKFVNLSVGDSDESNRIGAALFDAKGALWCVTETGLYRAANPTTESRFEAVIPRAPTGGPMAAFADRREHLWFGMANELIRIAQGQPVKYKAPEEVCRHEIVSITEDPAGRVLVANRRAVFAFVPPADIRDQGRWDRLPLALAPLQEILTMTVDSTGTLWIGTQELIRFKNGQRMDYSADQGLRGKPILAFGEDREGNLWIGSDGSGVGKLSRESPAAEGAAKWSPPIYISRIQIAGKDMPLLERGARQIPKLTLMPEQNDLHIQYIGLSFQGERPIRYESKLEGADGNWSPPSEQRWVHYPRLLPGSYRFQVRAVNAEGVASREPAMLAFYIESPDWQQWWFRMLALIAMAATALALYNIRVRRIVAMERVRQQIATDLHDNIGSGLAQIAILSEVAKREAAPGVAVRLDEMANLARAMREAMSDIVWAVDPRKDHLADLVQRMKQVAFNLLEAEGITVEFHAPEDEEIERIGLEPDRRRHVLLVFKETITNIARHAQASRVGVTISLGGGKMELTIRDDGRGFDPEARYEGQGLQNLRQRAQALSARLEISSAPGQGTTIHMRLPLEKKRR